MATINVGHQSLLGNIHQNLVHAFFDNANEWKMELRKEAVSTSLTTLTKIYSEYH
jgi:hypothetical protein